MSASATTRAPPVSTRLVASSVPRPPQPKRPTRTAEFAAVPRTKSGLMIIKPAVAAAEVIKVRRSTWSLEFLFSVASVDMILSWLRITLPDQLLQIILGGSNVFQLLWPGNFAFDGDRSAIGKLLQASDDAGKVYLAFPNRNFHTEIFRVGRPETIFCMDALNVGS